MMYFVIALFAVSAVFGLVILIKWLTRKNASRGVIYSHGIIAAIALVLLIAYAMMHPDNFPRMSIALFILAAIGGFYMFFNDLKKKESPLAIAFIHALLAIGGFLGLVFFTFL